MKHIPQLDGVRAVAIGLVLIYHFWPYPERFPFLNQLAYAGWMGVDLFFILSGFLITGILRDTRGNPRHFIDFYARRALRILPLYYLMLFFVLVILPRVYSGPDLPPTVLEDRWYFWLHLGNIALAHHGWQSLLIDITWSLALEEQFYLVWPALIYRLTNRQVLAVCAALIVGMPIVRLALSGTLDWLWLQLVFRADSFAVGAAIAVAAREFRNINALKWMALGWLPILALVAFGHFERHSMLVNTIGLTLVAAACAGLVLFGKDCRLFLWSPLRHLGKVSYGVYIYHPLCQLAVTTMVGNLSGFAQIFGLSLLSVAVATISYHALELPLLRLKRYFEPATAPTSPIVETTAQQSA